MHFLPFQISVHNLEYIFIKYTQKFLFLLKYFIFFIFIIII